MALRIEFKTFYVRDTKKRIKFSFQQWAVVGLLDSFARYEKQIIAEANEPAKESGFGLLLKKPAPYKVEFRNPEGVLVRSTPVPLMLNGEPKLKILDGM